MQTFDMSLFKLYKQGKISLDEALKNADSKNNLRLRVTLDERPGKEKAAAEAAAGAKDAPAAAKPVAGTKPNTPTSAPTPAAPPSPLGGLSLTPMDEDEKT
jgi:twitching motility protein PilU